MPCRVTAIRNQKTDALSGRLYDLNKDKLVLKTKRRAYEKRSIPYLGELPLIGRALFSTVTAHDQVVRDELPLNDVVCIQFIRKRDIETPRATSADKP
jgi:hypothetical protein